MAFFTVVNRDYKYFEENRLPAQGADGITARDYLKDNASGLQYAAMLQNAFETGNGYAADLARDLVIANAGFAAGVQTAFNNAFAEFVEEVTTAQILASPLFASASGQAAATGDAFGAVQAALQEAHRQENPSYVSLVPSAGTDSDVSRKLDRLAAAFAELAQRVARLGG